MVSFTVDEFLAAVTTGPTETKFWGSLNATLVRAEQHSAHAIGKDITCTELTNLAAEANRIALCAYLQGFYDLAWQISSRQITVLSEVACPCARICEVQPWVNLARLSRATIQPQRLDKALVGLDASLERALTIDPGSVPLDASVALLDGSIAKAAEYVGTLETAKLKWLLGEFEACEELARPAAPNSSVAMELTVRSLIELGRLDEAISLAATLVSKFAWLAAYAVIALLRGGASEEALRVLASIIADHPLPLMRVATELGHAGLSDDAAALGARIAEASISSGQEVPGQLAVAFMIANGYVVPSHLRNLVTHVASKSQHYPSVVLLYLAVALHDQDVQAVKMVAEGVRLLHHHSLPKSIQTILGSVSTSQSTLDRSQNGQSRISQSECITSRTASSVLAAMAAHN